MATSIFDSLVDQFAEKLERKSELAHSVVQRNKRPVKMPKDYDFSVRNVNWKEYEDDFILRTDAVWEKVKLKDLFYSYYKNFVYDRHTNRYIIANLRQMPMPTNEGEHFEDWMPFDGYTDVDGCIWQFRYGPKVQAPSSMTHFISDREGDSWYLCFLSFQKYMLCHERSPVKLDEAQLYTGGFWEYPCYDDVERVFDNCGGDLFEPMFEAYRTRLISGTSKP